jgi:hypothetical protein
VTAAGEAEVLPGDADPFEFLGRSEHPLDQLPILRLDLGARSEGRARLGNPLSQPVANRLQLAEIEDPGRGGDGVDPMRHLGVAEGLSEEAGQLRLETADLAAQLEPRPALVDPNPEPGELLSIQQSRHHEEV